jgi:hypothetical protein
MRQNKTDELKAMYQSTCPNAFFDLDYGGSPFGIFTAACPTEGLHQMEKGIILDCLNELFKNHMTTIMKSKLDAIVISWCALPNQQFTKAYMDVYPRLHFRDGITTLTYITANTVVGFMFAVVLAGLTRDGRSLFEDMDDKTYLNMIYTFESLLCFWAWLKKDKYWKIDAGKEALQTAEHAICILMEKSNHYGLGIRDVNGRNPSSTKHITMHSTFICLVNLPIGILGLLNTITFVMSKM